MRYEDEQIANLILSLKQLKGVGNKTILKLLIDKKDHLEKTFDYNQRFLESLGMKAIINGLSEAIPNWSELQKKSADTLESSFQKGITVLHPYMKEYPQRLLANKNFPPILFCKGDTRILNEQKVVAIIGTRKPTEFGEKMGIRLASILAEESYVIVSGLAIGCDTAGHRGALEVNGKTIAVLPTPIDAPVYPAENQGVANEIIKKGGVLISEYAPGTTLQGRQLISNLIARDEWQAGLSDGVIAVETSEKGGTNHAIKHAIQTKTPLGIFDYRSRLNNEFFADKRFGGNVKYITERKAHPIFLPETVEHFKKLMASYSNSLEKMDLQFNRKPSADDQEKNPPEQTTLF